MRLRHVTYRLFEHEVAVPEDDERPWHQLDGEIVLVGDDRVEFVSWCAEPVQYCIGKRQVSFFNAEVLRATDLSCHPFWRRLIGSDISMRFMDAQRQVLQIEGFGFSVFVSSQCEDGKFEGDCVRVSSINPL
jgi:hypothetical protein